MGDAVELLAGMVLDDGRPWGAVATGWQLADARAVLEPGSDDPRLHWLGRPKGGSKTTDVAGLSLSWLVAQAAPLAEGFVVAADEEQARRLLHQARGLVARTPGLSSRVRVEAGRIVNVDNGARLVALAADAPSAEGVLTGWIACDEVPNWPSSTAAKAMWLAMISAVPKVRGCRLVAIGHAGRPGSWQHRLYEQAETSARWRVADLPGPLEWIDPEALDEQRALLMPSEFARRHLNRWASGEGHLTTSADVAACVGHHGDLPSRRGARYVVALDVGLVNDRTALTVAHAEYRPGGRYVVVDRQDVWSGKKESPVSLAEVEEHLRLLSREYGRPLVVVDPYQAELLVQRLGAAGIRVERFAFTATSVGRLALTMVRLLREHLLDLPDDPELLAELAAVQIRETSVGSYRIDHEAGQHDDRVISLALAAHRLLDEPTRRRARIGVPVDAPHRRAAAGRRDARQVAERLGVPLATSRADVAGGSR